MERLRERTWLFVGLTALPITIYSLYTEGFTKNALLYSFVFVSGFCMYFYRRSGRLGKMGKK
jgi:hypothetical protein